ncbi:hypothetical protein Avbf_01044 [Armadillidium vulgare]|nr:hypothetical protein Avbf_01044 [Armadillidium vulgare]
MGNSQTKYNLSNGTSRFKNFEVSSEKSVNSSNSQNSNIYPDFLLNLAEVLENKSKEEGHTGIGEDIFQKYISPECPKLATALYRHFLDTENLKRHENKMKNLSKDAFVRQAYAVLNLLTDSQQLEYYLNVFSGDRDDMDYEEFNDFVTSCYTVAQFAHNSESKFLPDSLLSAVPKSAMHGKEKTSCKYLFNWICQHIPRLVMWMHRHINHTLTVGYSTIPQNTPTEETDDVTPVLDGLRSLSLATIHPSLIWLLSCSLPFVYTKSLSPARISDENLASLKDPHKFIQRLVLAGTPSHWIQLFSSAEHGLSVNRFKHHVFDYHGPTLLFLTTEDETMFCLASDEEWRDSKHFYGGMDSVCFQLYPEFKIIEKGHKLLYFNITSRGFPTGLQVGGDSTNRALSLGVDFQRLHYRRIPYILKSLEVWGCGTVNAKEKQLEYKKLVAKDVEKRRKVNIPLDWKDNPDRYLLELAGKRPNYARFEKDTQDHSSLS